MRELVLPQESIMGNTLSKCGKVLVNLHERMQWCRALGLDIACKKESYTVDQLLFSRDPGPVPDCFAAALDICCLLYTSPSPRDLSTSRMPSSA